MQTVIDERGLARSSSFEGLEMVIVSVYINQ